MTTFTEHVILDLPPDEAFALVSDYRHDPRWRAGVASMQPSTAGPARPGTRTEETIRFLGRTFVNPGRVVRVDGRCMEWEASSDTTRARGTRAIAPLGSRRSSFTYSIEVELVGAGGFTNAIVGRLFRRRVRKDLRRLRKLVREHAQLPLRHLAA